jgi:hypothetical protein
MEIRVSSLIGSDSAWVRLTNKSTHLEVELLSGDYFDKGYIMAAVANKQRDTYDFNACQYTWSSDKAKSRLDSDIKDMEKKLSELKFCRKAISRKNVEFNDLRGEQ